MLLSYLIIISITMIKISLKRILEKQIVKYIDRNSYLLKSDNSFIINCQLKPRLVSKATQSACSYCKKNNFFTKEEEYKETFLYSNKFAIKYLNKKN